MQITIGKVLGLLVAIGFVIAMILESGVGMNIAKGSLALMLPVALIWFPEELGSITGNIGRGGNINTETTPIIISSVGWLILLGIPVLAYVLKP